MTNCEQYIIDYAAGRNSFRAAELISAASTAGHSETSVNWTLRKLTSKSILFRTGHGIYTKNGHQPFGEEPDINLIGLSQRVYDLFPGVRACFYQGGILSPLLHHLSFNALTYIEVQREFSEVLFHRLRDTGEHVYLKPSREVIRNYLDISQPGIIVKPLISGSPLSTEYDIPMPTLEKLLVDTLCDEDFGYLQGGEWQYMIENAFSLFNINQSRLLRYAGRRGKLPEVLNAIKPNCYDTQRMLYKGVDRNGQRTIPL